MASSSAEVGSGLGSGNAYASERQLFQHISFLCAPFSPLSKVPSLSPYVLFYHHFKE